MAWTTPFTAISGTPYTAAQFNGFRDSMLETEVSRAQTVGGYCVTVGMNQLAERIPGSGFVDPGTADHTTSTSYTDLDNTTGPVVSVITGETAWVSLYASIQNSGAVASFMSYRIDGATTQDPGDDHSIQLTNGGGAFGGQRIGAMIFHTNLTPGLNTFSAQYRCSSGLGTFAARTLAVFPF
jgi:hypothetical protein